MAGYLRTSRLDFYFASKSRLVNVTHGLSKLVDAAHTCTKSVALFLINMDANIYVWGKKTCSLISLNALQGLHINVKAYSSLSVPYQWSTSVLLQLQISPHRSDASAPCCSAASRPGASRPASVLLSPHTVNVMCFPVNCPRNLSQKVGCEECSGSAYRSHVDPNQIIVVCMLRSQRAQGHESSLFGTRLFNRSEMVTRGTIDIIHRLKGYARWL